jgi:hypothetical protein
MTQRRDPRPTRRGRRTPVAAARRRLLLSGAAVVTLFVGAIVVPPIGGGHAEEPPATTDAPADTPAPADDPSGQADTTTTTNAPGPIDPATADEPPADDPVADSTDPQADDADVTDTTTPVEETTPTTGTTEPASPVDSTPVSTSDELAPDAIVAAAETEPPVAAFGVLASSGLSITLTDPFDAKPTTLDLGPRPQGVEASAFVTIVNDTGNDINLEVSTFDDTSLLTDTCSFRTLEATAGFNTCEVEIIIDTSVDGLAAGEVELYDQNTDDRAFVTVFATVFTDAPPNDDFADAQDISSVPVFPYRTAPDGTLLDAVPIAGTTEGATIEPNEDTNGGTRSVWYRYTSTSFEGRLGYRATAGFNVIAYLGCSSTQPPTIAAGCEAVGGASDTMLAFARVQPGMPVWFRVVDDAGAAPFILQLFDAPNQADAITGAAEVPSRGLGTGPLPAGNYRVVGDTFGVTPDLGPGSAPNTWFTFVLNTSGLVDIELTSEDAFGAASARPVEFTLYRAPTRNRVSDPALLSQVSRGTVVRDVFGGPTGVTGTDPEVSLTPGRYYVAVEVGEFGPTFFDGIVDLPLNPGGDVDPPQVSIVEPPDGAEYGQDVVPDVVEASCSDDVDPDVEPSVTVDGIATDELDDALGAHTVVVTCTDDAGNSATAASVYTVIPPQLAPVISISGPPGITVGSSGSVTVTASHPGGFGVVAAGFRFIVEVPFGGDLELPAPINGITCADGFTSPEVPGFSHVVCTSSNPLGQGQSVDIQISASPWTTFVRDACQPVDGNGKRVGDRNFAGGICVNVLAYPGEWQPNSINRALQGGDAVVVPIPLDGPYLRFTTAAPDTPEGSPVVITVVPRNPGTARQVGLAFNLGRYSPLNHRFEFVSADTPDGWTCTSTTFSVDCAAPGLSLDAGESGTPIVVRMIAPAPGTRDTSCPATGDPLPSPPPDPCGGFSVFWASQRAGIRTGVVAYRILPPAPPPGGPCVIVETAEAAFGRVPVGSTGQAEVTIRSCSANPALLAVAVSSATTAGSSDTWVASTSTTPPDGAFRWTVTPPGGTESVPLTGTSAVVGTLSGSATRTDSHRIRLGPTGPGIGQKFSSVITYTATEP